MKFFQPLRLNISFWILFFFVLILGFLYWHVHTKESSFIDKLWAVLDPVAGIMTFITTLVILYIQAYKSWEEGLEKHLSIDYVFVNNVGEEHTICQIVDAYLSGESDIRAWAQSLGNQVMGNLDFDMNWDEEKPMTIPENGKYYRKYKIKIYLTRNPFEQKPSPTEENKSDTSASSCRYEKPKDISPVDKFLAKQFKHSEVIRSDYSTKIIWKRKNL